MAVSTNIIRTSKVKEAVAAWNSIKQLLRSGDQGHLVPVVIPKDQRKYSWIYWLVFATYAGIGMLYALGESILNSEFDLLHLLLILAVGGIPFALTGAFAALGWMRGAIVEIEQGTVGVYSNWGKIAGVLEPGLQRLWFPWTKVEYIVDTSTNIPYKAPVLACPTQENVPLKSIEFFLQFRIVDPIRFVRRIGASNFDMVLSSAVQDAIRRRSRKIEAAKAYDLRGSNVEDMQEQLNQQLARYGVKIVSSNIPDVQLPDQYQSNLATRERVAKELSAYEKEWDLIKKRRQDTILMQIERAKKDRDEKQIAVKRAVNKAKETVAQVLQEREADAEKIRLDIEAKGRAELKAAQNEAKALNSLGKSYQNNEAVLRYELQLKNLQVARKLVEQAPRPVVVNTQGNQGDSALSTLMLAQMLPKLVESNGHTAHQPEPSLSRQALKAIERLSATTSQSSATPEQSTATQAVNRLENLAEDLDIPEWLGDIKRS